MGITLKKFRNNEFGQLTRLTNEQTGAIMFLAKEVAEMFGHKNVTQAVSRLLKKSEYKSFRLRVSGLCCPPENFLYSLFLRLRF